MATSRVSKATARRQSAAAEQPHIEVVLPDAQRASFWTPQSSEEQGLVLDALLPTLQYYAAEIGGWRTSITHEQVICARAEALRWWLRGAWRSSKVFTEEMIAAAWWRYLGDHERTVLGHWLCGFTVVVPSSAPAQPALDWQTPAQMPTLETVRK